jgi:hypothetical protein
MRIAFKVHLERFSLLSNLNKGVAESSAKKWAR